MKKALDQTVRDLKREVNKIVLKVPSIEQKTLDATSNEPWAPRGSLMAEIAQASCNYNDYQLVMTVLWKRLQDTGKNWRHVYKALSVLEYLVIYGSERVIDDIREHAYQISTLSDFLYTDSNGRDQGSNVRRKSQSLVALVNNKKRLQEVRDKALANKVSWPPLSSSARYNDEHFEGGNRGVGLVQRDLVLKDKDRYRDGGDKYSQDRPRSPSVDVYTNNSFDDYDRHSTRIDAPPSYEGATKDSWSDVQKDKSGPTETSSRDTNLASGSVTVESAQAHEKEVASFDKFNPGGSVTASPTVATRGLELDIFGLSAVDYTDSSASMLITSTAIPDDDMLTSSAHAVPIEPDENPFGDAPFKAIPREDFPSETNTSASATSQTSSGFVAVAEINLPVQKKMETPQIYDFGNTLGEPIYAPDVANGQHSLANTDFYASEFSAANSSKDILDGILPWTGPVASVSFQETQPADQSHFLSQQAFSACSASHAHNSSETGSAHLQIGQTNPFEQPEPLSHLAGQANPFELPACQPSPPAEIHENQMNSTENSVLSASSSNGLQASQMISMNKQWLSHTQTPTATSVPLHADQSAAPANYQRLQINHSQLQNLSFQAIPSSSLINNLSQPGLLTPQISQLASAPFMAVPSSAPPPHGNVESAQLNPSHKPMESSLAVPVSSQTAQQATSMSTFTSHSALPDLPTSSQGSTKPQPSSGKFEPKSAIWADTISRGLVNLNISGPRTNPLADIGVDFDDINRKERRHEVRSTQSPSSSSSAMGKAMGIGSGLGRAGIGTFTRPLNPSMGSNMGVGQPYMGMGMGAGMGMTHPSSGTPGFHGAHDPMNARGGHDGRHRPYGRGGLS